MINIPQFQNQERLPVLEQLKRIRSYLFQLAQELQRTVSNMESTQAKLLEENAELKAKISELERR